MVESPALSEALHAFGKPPGELPKRPVLHGASGTLLSFEVPVGPMARRIEAVWVRPDGVRFFGPAPAGPPPGPSHAHHLTGAAAELFDRWADVARAFHEAVEGIDTRLSELEARGPVIATAEIWTLSRETAALRAQIGRCAVASSECGGPLAGSFPGIRDALPSLLAELDRVETLASYVQQSLSDLILLQNAQESNRIAEAANRLSTTSNRIAELANTSNVRMLGITYVALVLGLVSAVVLIPNTGATILGMPSAAWVPGYWVDIVLVLLALLPLVIVFSRPWVRALLRTLAESEERASEGLSDIPERVPPVRELRPRAPRRGP
jgi:hypothetical protein